MTEKIKYSSKTDEAWKSLYSRLEDDGLLPTSAQEGLVSTSPCLPSGKFSIPLGIWLNAAAMVLFIGITLFYLFQKENSFIESKILTLYNAKGAPALVTTLEDGSIIYLGENASLYYPEHFAPEIREVELQGNALFDISGNKERPFLINTDQFEIEVLGTSFHVKSLDEETFEVSVKEGKVKVTSKENNHSVFVESGQTVSYHPLNGFEISILENENEFNQYTDTFHFIDEKLLYAVQVINRQCEDKMIQLDSLVENRLLTVTFMNNSIQEMAELISYALTINLEEKNNMFILSD